MYLDSQREQPLFDIRNHSENRWILLGYLMGYCWDIVGVLLGYCCWDIVTDSVVARTLLGRR